MSRHAVGVMGVVALATASVLAVAVVFFEKPLLAAGVPYHFFHYSLLATALFGAATVCGFKARGTPPGWVALVGGPVLGLPFVGFVTLVLTAFSTSG